MRHRLAPQHKKKTIIQFITTTGKNCIICITTIKLLRWPTRHTPYRSTLNAILYFCRQMWSCGRNDATHLHARTVSALCGYSFIIFNRILLWWTRVHATNCTIDTMYEHCMCVRVPHLPAVIVTCTCIQRDNDISNIKPILILLLLSPTNAKIAPLS